MTVSQSEELNAVINNGKSSGREVRRAQAILLLNEETKLQIITSLTSYSRRQIFDLRRAYLKEGIAAIQDKKKGKPKELLTKKQQMEIIEIIRTKSPRDYSYDWDYWTTGILGDFVKERYNVQYKSKTSFYIIFKRAKFSYHKPGRVYHQRDEKEVKKWREEAVVQLQAAWQEKGTIVLAEDEMVLSTQTTFQKIWLPEGKYPKIEVSNKKENRSIYGFLNMKTGKEHAFKANWQNMYITVKILKKIRGIYPLQKLLILWDGAGWHRGSEVQKFVKQDKNIKTLYFPRYAPEENPQEHVWKNGRSQVTNNCFIKNLDKTTDEFVTYLSSNSFPYSLQGFSAVS